MHKPDFTKRTREGELHARPSNFIVGLETLPVRLR